MTKAESLVEIWRGPFLESLHRGHAVVWQDGGGIVASWGDPGQVILLRSSCKMIQALPLVESGAADAAGLSEAHLALSCASHNAAEVHNRMVTDWITGLGLDPEQVPICRHAIENRAYPILTDRNIRCTTREGILDLPALAERFTFSPEPPPGWKGHCEWETDP